MKIHTSESLWTFFKMSCALIVLFAQVSTASAALISIQSSADMTHTLEPETLLIPEGTTVSASVFIEIPEGSFDYFWRGEHDPQSRTFYFETSGAFEWTHPIYGNQSFAIESTKGGQTFSFGTVQIAFLGNGPTINNALAKEFIIEFDIGIDPFSTEAEQIPFSALILGSTVTRFRLGAFTETPFSQSTSYGDLSSNVMSNISEVPAPAGLWLFLSACGALFARAKSGTTGQRLQ